jgi:DNA-binding HxlR family transcriptional regulator
MTKHRQKVDQSSAPDQDIAQVTKRPINELLDLFSRRWTLRILWELQTNSLTFRELQAACGDISTSVLNERLREMRAAVLVCHHLGEGYGLTKQGKNLMIAARPLLRWVPQWAEAVEKNKQ